ncbi:hypothetical protein BGZ83_003501 [Gryganskiella cystojenkinii]|nr:hypothetical protein BGZ83_003501 [Gryganskiella cystojenkinii]
MRGVGYMCQKAVQEHGPNTHLVCSSGGNAGLAVAYAARQLGVRVTIVVPLSCSEFMKQKMESEGATVEMEGEAWDEADKRARAIVASDPHGAYIPPFDHPYIWAGNSTMIDELKTQMNGVVPDAIVCSVGGGGLLNGIILGCQAAGWNKVPVIAIETHGANSFQQAVVAGKLVTLPKITSIATTLGAKRVSAKSLELSMVHPVIPFAVSDSMASRACWQFLDDHRILVEPSCGASLSVAYTPSLLSNVLPNLDHESNVVMIVCGGSNINFEQLTNFKTMFSSQGQQPAIAVRNGDQILLKMTNEEETPAQRYIISTLYSPPPSVESTNDNSSTQKEDLENERMKSPPAQEEVSIKTEESAQ